MLLTSVGLPRRELRVLAFPHAHEGGGGFGGVGGDYCWGKCVCSVVFCLFACFVLSTYPFSPGFYFFFLLYFLFRFLSRLRCVMRKECIT